MMRVFRLPGLKKVDMNNFKVDVELPSTFNIFKIPPWAWLRYDKMRKELANQALQQLKEATNMEDLDGYAPVTEGVKICKQNGLNWGVSTIQQNISRGVLVGQKINGKLCVNLESLQEVIEVENLKPT